jgi:hypothetical protein
MERLPLAILILSFIVSGAGLTTAEMLCYLLFGIASLNHVTLFSTLSLFTYYLYGFFGIMYVALSTLIFIACGLMYWFDMSLGDMQKKVMSIQKSSVISPDTDKTVTDNSQISQDMELRLKQLQAFKNTMIGSLCLKTGVTDDKINMIKNYYVLSSTKFDNFTDLLFTYIVRFRQITQDVMILKTIYYIYDQIIIYTTLLKSFRKLSNMASNMSHVNNNSNQRQNQPQTNESDSDISENKQNPDINMFKSMSDFSEMGRHFATTMTPEEKKLADDMAMHMMSGMGMGNLLDMMDNMNKNIKTDLNKAPQVKINGKKKKSY